MAKLTIDGTEITSGSSVYVHNFTSIFDSAPQDIQILNSTAVGGSVFTKKNRVAKRFRISLNLSFPTSDEAQEKAMQLQSMVEEKNRRRGSSYDLVDLTLSGFGNNVYKYESVIDNISFDQNHYNLDFYERINLDFTVPKGYGYITNKTFFGPLIAASVISGVNNFSFSGKISGISRVVGTLSVVAPPSGAESMELINSDTGQVIRKDNVVGLRNYIFDFERLNLLDGAGNVERSVGRFSDFLSNSLSGYILRFTSSGFAGTMSGRLRLSGIV